MGLAANKIGWTVNKGELWSNLKQTTQHLDASKRPLQKTYWSIIRKRMGYYLRLIKMRINSLTDINFYYF
jgi:hypothetical protein